MPYTVNGSFTKFQSETVDLDSAQTGTARGSRDFLYDQLRSLGKSDKDFPKLTNQFVPFGSFARRTKIRPLDDIDFLMLLDGTGTGERHSGTGYEYWLRINDSSAPLAAFPDGSGFVNSTKVLNQIKSSLKSVKSYRKADVKKNQQAVTLDLVSYPWVFDIVPAVEQKDWQGTTTHYLIPDGSGDWIRTNPDKDAAYITRVNKQHNGELLAVMRLLKYWNWRTHKPRLMPYYFETLALKVFDYGTTISTYAKAIKYFFENCPGYLLGSCPDPKALGPALDADVDWDTKSKVQAGMNEAATWAGYAVMYEEQDNGKDAVYWWGRVFGPEFPAYG